MKYAVCILPMFFGIEVLSWICLVLIAVMGFCDLALKIDEEKGGKF